MSAAHTSGTLIPCRSHEDHEGPYFEIDADEREYYNSRPFTKLVTREGVTVATAHDLFEFRPGDAERLALCWNALEGLDNDAVEKLGAWLHDTAGLPPGYRPECFWPRDYARRIKGIYRLIDEGGAHIETARREIDALETEYGGSDPETVRASTMIGFLLEGA